MIKQGLLLFLLSYFCSTPVYSQSESSSSSSSSFSSGDTPTEFEQKLEEGDKAVSGHDFEKAISSYSQGKERAEKNKNEYQMAESLRKIAVAYAGQGQYSQAIDKFKESLNHTNILNDPKDPKTLRTCILSKFGLSKMYSLVDNQELAWINCEEAISLSKENIPSDDPIVSRLTALKSELIFTRDQVPIDPTPEKSDGFKPSVALVAEINMTAPATIPEAPAKTPLSGKVQDTRLNAAAMARKELALRLMQHGTTGLLLVKNIGGPWTVEYPLRGGSARYYGVQKGDVLASIDGQDISTQNITSIYFMLTGKRGEMKHLELIRPGHKLELQIPLWSVYDMHDPSSEYIEYYWFLLYNGLITPEQYQRLAKPVEPYLHN